MDVLLAIAAYAVAFALIPFALVLPHEIGHAIGALAAGSRWARVEVDVAPRPLVASLGRLVLELRLPRHPRDIWFGRAAADWAALSRRGRIVFLAGGPLATIAVTCAYAVVGAATSAFLHLVCWFLAVCGVWTLVVTGLPLRYGRFFGPYAGDTSDGYKLVRLLRRRSEVTALPE